MTRKEFTGTFLNPLICAFGVSIVFNQNGFLLKNVMGSAFIRVKQQDKQIVLKYNKNPNVVLQVLFHELGHYLMHGTGSKFRGRTWLIELEVEYCAMYTCKLLNIDYNFYFCDSKDKKISDLEFMWRYRPRNSKTEPRYDLVKDCAKLISTAMKVILYHNPYLKLGEFVNIYSEKVNSESNFVKVNL